MLREDYDWLYILKQHQRCPACLRTTYVAEQTGSDYSFTVRFWLVFLMHYSLQKYSASVLNLSEES